MTFGIESANIVGYTTKEAAAGKFIIASAQFEGVKGGTKINDLVTGVKGVPLDEDAAFMMTAPQLQIPAAVGYDVYYYLTDGWKDLGDDNWVQTAGWCDSDGLIVDAEVAPGVAFWMKDAAGATINFAGAVPESDSTVVSCPSGFALRSNVYPEPLVINSDKMIVSGISGVALDEESAFLKTAPQLQVPAAVGYTVYFYLTDGWKDLGDDNWIQTAGWCDSDGLIVDDTIPVAQGFWTKGMSSGFSFTFAK